MNTRRPRGRLFLLVMGTLLTITLVTSCADRLGKDDAEPSVDDVPSAQLKSWAELHSDPYGIPVRVLQSYGYAAAAMQKADPKCNVGWPTLAAIGAVSSDHGTAGGGHVNTAGIVNPELRNLRQAHAVGAPAVSDTDAGHYDGSSTVDYPMGPMQILPSRWEQYATDADNDGKADPDNYDDATLTAARFLCAVGGDMKTAANWTAAVGQFNTMRGFVEKVHAQAKKFGR